MRPPSANRSPSPVPRLGHRRWLDGLRGLAILMVLGFHLHVLPGGFLGVDVFFVLSGFLITSLLIDEWQQSGTIELRRFYLRRALRLLPALVTLLLAYGLWVLALHPSDEAMRWREIGVATCYLTNWPTLHQTAMPLLGHTWSLSVEEQFYLLWPILLFGMLALGVPRRRILLVLGMGILTLALLRAFLYVSHHGSELEKAVTKHQLYIGLHTRGDALLIGCVVGLLVMGNLLPNTRRFRRGCSLAALAAALFLAHLAVSSCMEHCQYYLGLFTGVAVLVAVILLRLWQGPVRFVSPLLESSPLVGTGRISYGLYLFHVPIFQCFQLHGFPFRRHPGMSLLALGLSFAAALLSYYAVERPCLRLKDRCSAAPPRTAAPAVKSGTYSPSFVTSATGAY